MGEVPSVPSLRCCCSQRVHAASKKERLAWREAFAWFVMEYREAAERLRNGDREAAFPEGSFPPRLPFVGMATAGGVPLEAAGPQNKTLAPAPLAAAGWVVTASPPLFGFR